MIEIPQEIKNSLAQAGLDRAQIQVFYLLLQKNMQSIQEITNNLKLPRSSVQLACETLLERGVLKVSPSGKRRDFYIENPKDIQKFVEYNENQIQAQKITLQKITPTLAALSAIKQGIEPIDIEDFSGADGFVEVFYRSLNQPKNGEVLRFAGDPQKFNVERERLVKYREERVKKKIFAKLLQPATSLSKDEKKDAKFKFREVRTLPLHIYNPDVNIAIWQNSVSITVWDKGLHSIVLTNKAFADFMRQQFEISWQKAEK